MSNSLESGYTATLNIERPAGKSRITIVCETWDDGNLEGAEAKHRNPVTRKETARGGLKSRGNVTLTVECDSALWAQRADIDDAINIDKVTAIKQMIAPRGETLGDPQPVTGLLKSAAWPKYDLAGDGVGMVTFEVSADE